MDKFDYVKAQATAKRLIGKFGEAGAFSRVIAGGTDNVTGVTTPETTNTINGTVTPVLKYKSNEINGESVQRGDGYVFFDGDEIAVNDTITINGELFRAVFIDKIESVAGVLVYQKVQLRR